MVAAGCSREPIPTRIDDVNLAKLDGSPAKGAEAAARSAYDSLPTGSVAQMATALSVSGAAELIGIAADAIEAELQQCVIDVYLMGIAGGFLSERSISSTLADSVTCEVGQVRRHR